MSLDQKLHHEGLTLQAVIKVPDCQVPLPAHALQFQQMIVLGHGGPSFFDNTFSDETVAKRSDPLDERSIELFEKLMSRVDCTEFEILYPTQHDVLDLRSLGKQLGWQNDSQLGIGIHPEWGTWFAFRLVAVANTTFPVSQLQRPVDSCGSCASKPCLAACPVSATGDDFRLDACVGERLRAGASCTDLCLAREACPVGIGHRYSREQIRYHYAYSYRALKRR